MHDFTYHYEKSRTVDGSFVLVRLQTATIQAKDKRDAILKIRAQLGTDEFQLERGGVTLYSGLLSGIAYMFPAS